MKNRDLFWARQALRIAQRGGKRVHPNPKVGCVLVKNGKIVAQAWHQKFGGPHAEALALKIAGPRAHGVTAYVSLEPCMDFPGKKTPSCARALADAGVSRVVIAAEDPNPQVSGRGIKLLRRRGVKVRTGILKQEALSANLGFAWRQGFKRPYVILKLALSLDGQAFAIGGKSKWITGPAARREVHLLRSRCDAVLVGIETVIKDNPELTAHGVGPNPLRVVLDSLLRIPKTAKILNAKAKTVILTASSKTIRGAPIIRIPRRKGRLDLKAALRYLADQGVGILLVEGGPTVCASFLKEKLADEACFFIAPKFLSGTSNPNRAPRLPHPSIKKIGSDFLFQGRLSR